jgi:hypothetical protein
MNFSVKTLLALGFAGTLAGAANAQLPTTYSQGDFLLGFREVGSTKSVVVDIGSISSFNTPQDFAIDLGSTLAAQYGSGWATNANVYFSLAETQSGRTSTVTSPEYLTGPNAGPATVWPRLTSSNSLSLQNDINNLGAEFTSSPGVESNTTDADAYANFMPGGTNDAGHANGNIAWGFFNPTTEGALDQGTAGVELDVIKLVPSTSGAPGTEEGDFTLSPDGNTLIFTPAGAVPEPSSFAAMAVIGALALLGFQVKKARKSSAKRQIA